ncbi:MAG: helix-turn-helix transcriptional regulator [bacterium]
MLALVKRPHTELSLRGEHAEEVLTWIRKKYEVSVLSADTTEDSIPVRDTAFWRELEKNRVGNLLAGARLKAGMTQAQLARKIGIRQSMVSEYERGRRPITQLMAKRLSKALKIGSKKLLLGEVTE